MEQAVNEANAKRTAEMVANMTWEEKQEVVKSIPSRLMFKELENRYDSMRNILSGVGEILGKVEIGADETAKKIDSE